MSEQLQNDSPAHVSRTTGEKIAFWILWSILLTPALILWGQGSMGILLSLPQVAIHVLSVVFFLSTRPFSKVMLVLLGGTGLLYFLAFGSCVAILFFGMGNGGFH